jgi:hypothetical protein
VRRQGRLRLGVGLAAGLACVACCLVELSVVGGLSAVTIGAELTEFARFTPLLALTVPAGGAVAVLRRRRRRRVGQSRPGAIVTLPTPQRRRDEA